MSRLQYTISFPDAAAHLIDVALDLSGRPHVEWHVEMPESLALGSPAFDPQLAEHVVTSFATSAGITLHVEIGRASCRERV